MVQVNPELLAEKQPTEQTEMRKRTQSFPLVVLLKQAVFSAMEKIFDNKTIKVQTTGEKELEQALLRLNRSLEGLNLKKFQVGRSEIDAEQMHMRVANLETLQLDNVHTLSFMSGQLEPLIRAIRAGNQLNHNSVVALNKVLVSLGVVSNKMATLRPKDFPIKELTTRLDELATQVSNIRLEVPAPQEIKIPEMPKSIGIDEGKDILKSLKNINESLKDFTFEFPTEAEDAIPVRLSDGGKFYNAIAPAIRGIVGGVSVPKISIGNGEDAVSVASGLALRPYDAVSMALSAGDTTETYTFSSLGTTTNTVVIVYTDSTRETLSTVTKT